jgi:hypothetical protein
MIENQTAEMVYRRTRYDLMHRSARQDVMADNGSGFVDGKAQGMRHR